MVEMCVKPNIGCLSLTLVLDVILICQWFTRLGGVFFIVVENKFVEYNHQTINMSRISCDATIFPWL